MNDFFLKENPNFKQANDIINEPISSVFALETILNYELHDWNFVDFLFAVRLVASLKSNASRYILIKVSEIKEYYTKNNKMLQPYIYELMLLGGIINKGKETWIGKTGNKLEIGYYFDKAFIDKIVIKAINKIAKDGNFSEYYTHIKNLLSYPDFYKPELEKMPYKLFLETTYWQILKQITAYTWDYECAVCTSKKNLQVHHRTYAHRGHEHLHMKDLILLCAECHGRAHLQVRAGVSEGEQR